MKAKGRGVRNYIDDPSGSHCQLGIHIYSIEQERERGGERWGEIYVNLIFIFFFLFF
jgi:hypothetical protein